jgi:tetratricopeptide (TPR) repeat protein
MSAPDGNGSPDRWNLSGVLYAASQREDQEKQAAMFANSINLYNKYLEMTGDSGITNYYRGKAYFALNDFEKAVNDFKAAFEVGLDKPDLMSLIGRSYSKLKEYNNAIEALNNYEKSILSENPNYEWKEEDAQLFNERANAYAGLGDSASRVLASEDYEKALELDSSDAMMYYRAGLNEYFLQNFDKALEYYSKSIELYPDNPSAYLNIAYSYLGLENWDSTIAYINQALDMNPEYTSAFELLAKVFFKKNEFDSAIVYYRKTKEINPKDCEADRWIGLIYLVRDNPQPKNCIRHLKMYLDCLRTKGENPCKDIEVYIWIAKAYQMQNDPNGAFEWAEKGLKCDPNNEELKTIYDEMDLERDL